MATLKPITRIETEFVFFYNTPFTNYQNSLIFESNNDRDNYFLKGNYFKSKKFDFTFNYIMDRSTLKIPNNNYYDYYSLLGINYCTFIDNTTKTRIYAYVTEVKYVNSGVTEIKLLIDGIMTYCQGRTLEKITPVTIERQHLTKNNYEKYLNELKNNDDIIQTYTKNYFFETSYTFKDYICLILSSADLTVDFGNKDKPNMESSVGGTFDKISSPLDIYAINQKDFKDFSSKLKSYPWIAQNIKKVILIPSNIITLNKHFQKVTTKFGFNNLYRMNNNSNSDTYNTRIDEELLTVSFTYDELLDLFNLKKGQDEHLLRNGYGTLEIYAWNGQKIDIDLSKIREKGLKFRCEKIIGYENEIVIYPLEYDYKENGKTKKLNPNRSYEIQPFHNGGYLNNAIFFKNFDTAPVLIDNANLAYSKTANQRALNESRLITNRIDNIKDPKSSLESKFYDSASLISNISPNNILGKFTDEYEFYRTQKAQYKDMALQTPSLTEQTTGNAFQVKYNTFGINLKFTKVDDSEMEKIKTYYKANGYEINRFSNKIDDIFSQTVCNYLKVKGNYFIDNVPSPIMEMIRTQLENGIRLWHNTKTHKPFTNIENNEIKEV